MSYKFMEMLGEVTLKKTEFETGANMAGVQLYLHALLEKKKPPR